MKDWVKKKTWIDQGSMALGALCVFLMAMTPGCSRENIYGIARTEATFIPVENILGNVVNQETDLLIILDSSGSMDNYQQAMADLGPEFNSTYFSNPVIASQDFNNCIAGVDSDGYMYYDDPSGNDADLNPGQFGCTDDLTETEMDQVIQRVFDPNGSGGRERLLNSMLAFIDNVGTQFIRPGNQRFVTVSIGDEPAQDLRRGTGAPDYSPMDIFAGNMNGHYIDCNNPITVQLRDGNFFSYDLVQGNDGNCIDESVVDMIDVQDAVDYVENFLLVHKGGDYTADNRQAAFAITHQKLETLQAAIGGNGSGVYGINKPVEEYADLVKNLPGGIGLHFDIALSEVENVLTSLGSVIQNLTTSIELLWEVDEVEPDAVQVFIVYPDGTEVEWDQQYWTINGTNFALTAAGIAQIESGVITPDLLIKILYLPACLGADCD